MESAAEILNNEAPFKAMNDITQNHISNNEADGQVVDKKNPLDGLEEIFLGQRSDIEKENDSLDEVNIPANEVSSKTDKDIFFNKEEKDKYIHANEQDSGVFEDAMRQDCEILEEDGTSVVEQIKSVDEDSAFPTLNEGNFPRTVEDVLNFHKGILEDDSSNDESLLHSQPKKIVSDFILSDPPSPVEDGDESDEELNDPKSEKERRSTRHDLSLPYFTLPKPDLDDFLTETEKNLDIPVKSVENTMSDQSSLPCKSKPKSVVTLKPPPGIKGNFFDPKKVFITLDLSPDCADVGPSRKKSSAPESSHEASSGLFNNEYGKVISSINIDESKTPGIKRLVLKEFLKKQIDQKKYEAFNQSKILTLEDEEIETNDYEEDVEVLEDGDDESSDEYEEATVSFDKNYQEFHDESGPKDESTIPQEPNELQSNEESSSDENDDFIGVRKTKKKFLVLDEDSFDSDNFLNEEKKDDDSLNKDCSPLNELKVPEIIGNKLGEKTNDKLNISDADINNREMELSKTRDVAFGVGSFQTPENNNVFSQISSSMPSYQPGGGFLNQDLRQDDSTDSNTSSTHSQDNIHDNTNEENEDLYEHLEPEQKVVGLSKMPDLENQSALENESFTHNDDSNTFAIKFDDLPVSQSVNDSDIFLTEELADVCSGAFDKKDAVSEKKLQKNLQFTSEQKVTDFFDDEAELSGEDDGVDERDDSECEGDNLDLYASDEENLPAAEVLREEIADLHMKRLMDEDEERIKEIQEQFLDDGELNSDGAGRSRRFAWLNNDVEIAPGGNNSDSDSDVDGIDDSLSLNQEKAKWRQENKEDENKDLTEDLNSSGYRRRSFLKVDIIGKLKFSQEDESAKRLSYKRPRGSYLNLDDGSASQVLKKLKASEDNFGGSRTTKHFVFRNDVSDVSVLTKEVPKKLVSMSPSNISGSPKIKSVFSKI